MKKRLLLIIPLFAIFSSIHGANLKVSTDKPEYWRYEIVTLICEFEPPAASIIPSFKKKKQPSFSNMECTAKIFHNNALVTTVGKTTVINLSYNRATKKFTGKWPIPFNPKLGEYRAMVLLKDGSKKHAGNAAFKIKGRTAPELPKGFSVMNIEPGDSIIRRVPGVGGRAVKVWENYVLWSKFMGADAMWHCVGQSQIWDKPNAVNSEEFPWDQKSVRQMGEVGEELHRHNIKYGTWITSFVLLGNRQDLSPYAHTTGYDKENDTLRKLIYVSIKDKNRHDDIAALLKKMNSNPNVDYVGLDYVRTDFGGYEYASEFVSDMPVRGVPYGWYTLTEEDRMLWLGRKIEKEKNRSVIEMWQWWRAHKMSQIIIYIREKAKITKPMWAFTLTWEQGRQHGQDPLMFIDAGIDMTAAMYYSIDKLTYPMMITDWRNYLSRGKTSLVAGQCVDWNLLGKTYDPSGPDEHFLRQQLLVDRLIGVNPSLGLFWHDLTRAFLSTSGPYSSLEWGITGAASFTYLRKKQGYFPFTVTWDAPDEVKLNTPFTMEINIKNNSKTGGNYVMKPMRIANLAMSDAIDQSFYLAPGEIRTFNINMQAAKIDRRKQNMQMIAFMIQYGDKQTQKRYFEYKYVKVEQNDK
ncbi:MAG: hypothetical protein JXR81_05340 [Candidatus Goldbacteria bacterium]|nr:hypothetical protein [Candidatus Goldiibacteriota bacterium]